VTTDQTARRLRTLVVTPYGTSAVTGGAEKWLLTMLRNTRRLDVEVVALQDGPLRQELDEMGIAAEVSPTGPSAPAIGKASLALARRLVRSRPEIVVGNGVKAQVVVAPAARLLRVPTVWVKHDHSFDGSLAVPLGRLSDLVVATVEEVGLAVRRDDVVVISPPLQSARPAGRAEARRHLAGHGLRLGERPTMLMAGRVVPYKGIDDAVQALALPEAAGWELAVVGEDDHSSPGEIERLRRQAEQLGVGDRVRWCSPVPELGHYIAAFDALAVLTKPAGRRTPGREGFGMVAFEAMQAGVPVIAVEGGAIVRRLGGVAGIPVPAADPAAVATAMQRLAVAQVRERMGAAARDLLTGYATVSETADLFATTLATVAGRPDAGRNEGVS
jgi:glycosyltransferase involved in cell wall biosynthesis